MNLHNKIVARPAYSKWTLIDEFRALLGGGWPEDFNTPAPRQTSCTLSLCFPGQGKIEEALKSGFLAADEDMLNGECLLHPRSGT